jgi:hypothetical protein
MIAVDTREDPAVTSRRDLIAAAILTMTMTMTTATALCGPAAASQDNIKPPTAANLAGLHDFDFLNGDWKTRHRKLKPGSNSDWVAFDGVFTQRPLMSGWANSGDNLFQTPDGPYRGVSLRAYDPKTGLWAVWWLDGRDPGAGVGKPNKGRFENGVGRFYSDGTRDGKPVRWRVVWSRPTPVAARWEQAVSTDGGKTWAVNWTTDFTRAKAGDPTVADGWIPAAGKRDGPDAFDTRPGDRHRRLKERLAGSTEWVDFDGVQTWWPTLAGLGNVDDNVFAMPDGAYNGVTLRAYDPKTDQWSIWWLDGRNPHGDLEPPMKGRFVDGVASFYADDTLRGKPIKVRFIWSNITPTTAHWEQAFSPDDGQTWETNWFSDFSRQPPRPR